MVPGIVGGICLILAFYSMHTLPVNYAGVALIFFGIILFLLEIKVVSYGMLTIGGVVSVLLGSLMLIKKIPGMEFLRVSLPVIISSTVITTLFFLVIIGFGLKAQKAKPVTGAQGLINALGECISGLEPLGTVRVKGELWNAKTEGEPIQAGDKIRVKSIKGLTLIVEQA
jgi:membrane-bound serine protease (ClpP class)